MTTTLIRQRPILGSAAAFTLVLLGAALLAPGAAAAATRPTTFALAPGESCVGGSASDDATVELAWRDSTGALKAKTDVPANSWGSWSYCSPDGSLVLEIGDRLKATVGSNSRRFTVPNVTLVVDRVADEFRGEAPAGSSIVFYYHAALFADYYEEVHVTVPADGTWSHAPESWNGIMGGINAELWWENARGDTIFVTDTAPFITINLGRAALSGLARPGDEVVAELQDAVTGAVRATGRADATDWGSFGAKFRKGSGKAVPAQAGDRLVAPIIGADADWIIPDIEGTANPDTDRVRGRCFDTGVSAEFVQIEILRSGNSIGGALGSTDGDGYFRVRFTGSPAPWFNPANIRSGDRVDLGCLQVTGDWVRTSFVVP